MSVTRTAKATTTAKGNPTIASLRSSRVQQHKKRASGPRPRPQTRTHMDNTKTIIDYGIHLLRIILEILRLALLRQIKDFGALLPNDGELPELLHAWGRGRGRGRCCGVGCACGFSCGRHCAGKTCMCEEATRECFQCRKAESRAVQKGLRTSVLGNTHTCRRRTEQRYGTAAREWPVRGGRRLASMAAAQESLPGRAYVHAADVFVPCRAFDGDEEAYMYYTVKQRGQGEARHRIAPPHTTPPHLSQAHRS